MTDKDFENGIREAKILGVQDDIREIKETLNAINSRCMRQCGVLPYFRVALGALFTAVGALYAWIIYIVTTK